MRDPLKSEIAITHESLKSILEKIDLVLIVQSLVLALELTLYCGRIITVANRQKYWP